MRQEAVCCNDQDPQGYQRHLHSLVCLPPSLMLNFARKARRLTEESTKVAALEGSLARTLQDFQKDRKALTAAFAAERSEAQADIRALRQLAKARGRALHKVSASPAAQCVPNIQTSAASTCASDAMCS